MRGIVTLSGALLGLGIHLSASATVINVPTDSATIQGAINMAINNDEIVVAPGTYTEALDFGGKVIRLRSSGGPAVTTISGIGLNDTIITLDDGEPAGAMVIGFTISGGTGTPSGPGSDAGAMLLISSNATISECIFKNNSATNGGAIFMAASNPKITNCLFYNNEASQGSAMYTNVSSPIIQNCTFAGNSTKGGKAIYAVDTMFASSPRLISCIVWSNDGGSYGGELPNVSYSNIEGGAPPGGTGNIDLNPLFVSLGSGNARLSPGSPSIDAGNSQQIANTHFKDLDGAVRGVNDPAVPDTSLEVAVFGICCDMGCYERQVAAAPVTCPGDINGDDMVDVNDLLMLIGAWGGCPDAAEAAPPPPPARKGSRPRGSRR